MRKFRTEIFFNWMSDAVTFFLPESRVDCFGEIILNTQMSNSLDFEKIVKNASKSFLSQCKGFQKEIFKKKKIEIAKFKKNFKNRFFFFLHEKPIMKVKTRFLVEIASKAIFDKKIIAHYILAAAPPSHSLRERGYKAL